MPQSAKPMQGKVCLVTGATSGLGKATATQLAALGATVVLGCRDRAKGEAVKAEIASRTGSTSVELFLADLGSARCIVAAAKKLADPDFDKLFRAVANTWASTTSRQMREYLAVTDVHAPDKLRCNRVLQTLPEFYETYGIQPGDGMWTDPASRVSVW